MASIDGKLDFASDIDSLIKLFAPEDKKQELCHFFADLSIENAQLKARLRSLKALVEEQDWHSEYPKVAGDYLVAIFCDESNGPGYYETILAHFEYVRFKFNKEGDVRVPIWCIDNEISTIKYNWREIPTYRPEILKEVEE